MTTTYRTHSPPITGGLEGLTQKTTWSEFIMMFLMLAISGNPYFSEKFEPILVSLSIIPIYYTVKNHHRKIQYITLGIFTFMLGYEVMHSIMFSQDYTLTYFSVFLKLWIGFSVVKLLDHRFVQVLVDTMVVISVLSLIFTFLSYVPGINRFLWNLSAKLFPITPNYFDFAPRTLIVYTLSHEFFEGRIPYVRNAGIFWESGAFSVFLCITLFLSFISKSITSLNDLFDRKSAIMIFTLATTTSTTGLVGLVTILFLFSFRLRSKMKYVFLLLFSVLLLIAFTNVSYLGDKIEGQLARSGVENNRFGSAMKDFEDIMRRPILGWSRRLEVLFDSNITTVESHRPNGFTNFLRSYGLLYFSFYFYFVYLTFSRIIKYYGYHNKDRVLLAWAGIFIMWLVSFSELIYDKLFLKSFVFIHLVYMGHQVIASSKKTGKYVNTPNKPDFRLLES